MTRFLRLCAVLALLLSCPRPSAPQELTLRERRIAAVILRLDRLVTLIDDHHRTLTREVEALEAEVEDLAK